MNVQSQPETTSERSTFSVRSILSWLLTVALLLCAAGILFINTHAKVLVEGDSMNVTLQNGEVLCIDQKFEAKRGDIVIIDTSAYLDENLGFISDEQGNSFIIKRLIAVEGDSVYCSEGVVYICYEGQSEYVPLEEQYVSSEYTTEDFATVTVGEGEIFVMGDNRSPRGSLDSRAVGCLLRSELIAVVPDWAYAVRGFTTFWYNLLN